jgi:hypothetical protein
MKTVKCITFLVRSYIRLIVLLDPPCTQTCNNISIETLVSKVSAVNHGTWILSHIDSSNNKCASLITQRRRYGYSSSYRYTFEFAKPSFSQSLAPLPPTHLLSGHLHLIEGEFADISRYAGTTVDWVSKVAHLICDPLGAGQLYTHTTGMSSNWFKILTRVPIRAPTSDISHPN